MLLCRRHLIFPSKHARMNKATMGSYKHVALLRQDIIRNQRLPFVKSNAKIKD